MRASAGEAVSGKKINFSKKKGLCILMMKFLFLILFIILGKRTFRATVALPAGIVTAGYMEEINKDESL